MELSLPVSMTQFCSEKPSEIGTASQKTIHFNVLEILEEVMNEWYKFKPLFKEKFFFHIESVSSRYIDIEERGSLGVFW